MNSAHNRLSILPLSHRSYVDNGASSLAAGINAPHKMPKLHYARHMCATPQHNDIITLDLPPLDDDDDDSDSGATTQFDDVQLSSLDEPMQDGIDSERIDSERIDSERIDSECIDSECIDSECIDSECIDSGDDCLKDHGLFECNIIDFPEWLGECDSDTCDMDIEADEPSVFDNSVNGTRDSEDDDGAEGTNEPLECGINESAFPSFDSEEGEPEGDPSECAEWRDDECSCCRP